MSFSKNRKIYQPPSPIEISVTAARAHPCVVHVPYDDRRRPRPVSRCLVQLNAQSQLTLPLEIRQRLKIMKGGLLLCQGPDGTAVGPFHETWVGRAGHLTVPRELRAQWGIRPRALIWVEWEGYDLIRLFPSHMADPPHQAAGGVGRSIYD